ncbi:tetrahydromethanopterin S-methyltransferase subunit D [Methanocalculus chunghsingensis]|uniref:Tetrahydromethanopterin S-methyltransferase subunit D n=1 Tax=Methanocalculus chunghsingensis TaxID=156457 RepID=A0A8J7W7Z0_9EURY|nr:tetrahydromethanopterin S-methyltransferase subunit D [Methanocalculus chunghsingensis]MBR1369351.1 tetrahydromethanopterin S-methyltransferase subunit D [Methanocalculus chunghsingensis]
MSAIASKPAGGAEMPVMGAAIAVVLLLAVLGIGFGLTIAGIFPMAAFYSLIGIIIGGMLVTFSVHLVPVGGAPAAMGQAPGIATGVTMLAAGAGLAGLFKGAWAAQFSYPVALGTGAIGGALLMAITCMLVNVTYVFAMGIPAASGKVNKDPLTGDTQPEYKSQGTEGHGLPFISYVGGVLGGLIGGFGGTLIYLSLYDAYLTGIPALMGTDVESVMPLIVSIAGIFAIGMFLVNAVLTAYNITGTIEGPHDPKFKRFPRAIVASAVASALSGLLALLIIVPVPF